MWAGVSAYAHESLAMLDGTRVDRTKREDPGSRVTDKCWRGKLQSLESINLNQAFQVMTVYLSR